MGFKSKGPKTLLHSAVLLASLISEKVKQQIFFFFSQKLSMGGFSGALNTALWLVCGAQEGTTNPEQAQPWAGRQLQEDRSQGFRNLFKRNFF